MRRELFQPTDEGEARLLILISVFSRGGRCLEGRTKLAKLDFFLRYPHYLRRALTIRGAPRSVVDSVPAEADIETNMVRYRYGPWDPSYFALLGRLIGKRLIDPFPYERGIGYRSTDDGDRIVEILCRAAEWQEIRVRAQSLLRRLDLNGHRLMKFIYDNFPEVSGARWGTVL